MRHDVFTARRPVAADRCEHCAAVVDRVWLVPGDVLHSCRDCYSAVMGRPPVHEQGHSSGLSIAPPGRPRPRSEASFPRWRTA